MSATTRVEVLADAVALARAAAERFRRRALAAVDDRGTFAVALAGGSTPRALYELLAAPPYREEVPWSQGMLAIGDERHVPPDHADSNYGMVRRALLDRLPVAPRAVCRFRAELDDVETVLRRYESDLRQQLDPGAGRFPRFDLVLLGLGRDAHTASLFPHGEALDERERWAAAARDRFTLTPPVLNAAQAVIFLVSGEKKAGAVRDVLRKPYDPRRRPAQIVRPADGLVWMLDAAAARLLSG